MRALRANLLALLAFARFARAKNRKGALLIWAKKVEGGKKAQKIRQLLYGATLLENSF
jgi:hypothetical protein